jgi:hypothetical protein
VQTLSAPQVWLPGQEPLHFVPQPSSTPQALLAQVGAQTHSPAAVHISPALHDPQLPLQVSGPHFLPPHWGAQTH